MPERSNWRQVKVKIQIKAKAKAKATAAAAATLALALTLTSIWFDLSGTVNDVLCSQSEVQLCKARANQRIAYSCLSPCRFPWMP